MDRLIALDVEAYVKRMRAEVERTLRQVAEAVNQAPAGCLINGSEFEVRDCIRALGQTAFQEAVQMRIDSTESSFSPSGRCAGPGPA